jgi:DNA-binding NarL/FixJ family response regulator
MIRPPHGFDSVVRELFCGLCDGTIVLEQSAANAAKSRTAVIQESRSVAQYDDPPIQEAKNAAPDHIRILVADASPVVRRGLSALLGSHAGWQVVGEAQDSREAVSLAIQLKPNVALLDLNVEGIGGLEASRQIRKEVRETEVLVFSMYESEQFVRDILAAGARGYVLKSDAAATLMVAVETVASHKAFFRSEVAARVLAGYRKLGEAPAGAEPAGVLTPRERELIQLLAEGRTNAEVSKALGVTVKTVETHRESIRRKLRITSITPVLAWEQIKRR